MYRRPENIRTFSLRQLLYCTMNMIKRSGGVHVQCTYIHVHGEVLILHLEELGVACCCEDIKCSGKVDKDYLDLELCDIDFC